MVLPILYHWLCRLNSCEPQNSYEQTWLPVWCCSDAGPLVGDWVQGRAAINGINALIKESPPPSHNWGHRERMAICEPGGGSLLWQYLLLGLPGCGAESKNVCCSEAPQSMVHSLLWQPQWTDTDLILHLVQAFFLFSIMSCSFSWGHAHFSASFWNVLFWYCPVSGSFSYLVSAQKSPPQRSLPLPHSLKHLASPVDLVMHDLVLFSADWLARWKYFVHFLINVCLVPQKCTNTMNRTLLILIAILPKLLEQCLKCRMLSKYLLSWNTLKFSFSWRYSFINNCIKRIAA